MFGVVVAVLDVLAILDPFSLLAFFYSPGVEVVKRGKEYLRGSSSPWVLLRSEDRGGLEKMRSIA